MSDFKKTVNLKDRMQGMEERKKPAPPRQVNKAGEIDKLFENEKTSDANEFKKMTRPKRESNNLNPYKGLVFVLIIVILFLVYYSFFRTTGDQNQETINMEEKWYSVELVNGEVFYGLISDVKADPLVVKNVYYNYDQEKDGEEVGSGNLRLVKRGKETHGPDGSINIIRTQVKFFEELKPESKVLQAILANEE